MRFAEHDYVRSLDDADTGLTLAPIDLPDKPLPSLSYPTMNPTEAADQAAMKTAEMPGFVDGGELDLGDQPPPVVLLRLRRAFQGLAAGGEVGLRSTAANIAADLQAFQKITGATVSPGDSPQSFRIRKK